MYVRQVAESAQQLTALLGPEGIDRRAMLPVAALAIWSEHGRVAIMAQSNPLPMTGELPPYPHIGPRRTPRATINILWPLIRRLNVPDDCIVQVTGLLGFDGPRSALVVDTATPANERRTVVLPYCVEVSGQPQLPNANWQTPSIDIDAWDKRATPLGLRTGALMLNRLARSRTH